MACSCIWQRRRVGARAQAAERPGRCFLCGEEGHWRGDCPRNSQRIGCEAGGWAGGCRRRCCRLQRCWCRRAGCGLTPPSFASHLKGRCRRCRSTPRSWFHSSGASPRRERPTSSRCCAPRCRRSRGRTRRATSAVRARLRARSAQHAARAAAPLPFAAQQTLTHMHAPRLPAPPPQATPCTSPARWPSTLAGAAATATCRCSRRRSSRAAPRCAARCLAAPALCQTYVRARRTHRELCARACKRA